MATTISNVTIRKLAAVFRPDRAGSVAPATRMVTWPELQTWFVDKFYQRATSLGVNTSRAVGTFAAAAGWAGQASKAVEAIRILDERGRVKQTEAVKKAVFGIYSAIYSSQLERDVAIYDPKLRLGMASETRPVTFALIKPVAAGEKGALVHGDASATGVVDGFDLDAALASGVAPGATT